MRTLGLYLVIIGISSFVLMLFDVEFRIFTWMDVWGDLGGLFIRLALIIFGLVLMFRKPKSPYEQFRELREIEEIEQERKKHSEKES